MPRSKFETERLVGIQLRAISGDITREFREGVLTEIYTDDTETINEISKNCSEWAFNVGAYLSNEEKKRLYNNLLIIYDQEKIDPKKDKLWKLLMKLEMPIEFFKMFDKFTQVPQLSARNKAKPKEEEEQDWFELE